MMQSRLQIHTDNILTLHWKIKAGFGKLLVGNFGPYWGRCIETPFNPYYHPMREHLEFGSAGWAILLQRKTTPLHWYATSQQHQEKLMKL
jgi:hypothetical protein